MLPAMNRRSIILYPYRDFLTPEEGAGVIKTNPIIVYPYRDFLRPEEAAGVIKTNPSVFIHVSGD
jgi:hypothetical protein